MTLSRLKFKPGIDKEGTQFSAGPGWYDCNHIRFRKGRVESIGGWEYYTANSYKGVARSLYDWGTADAAQYLGVGTNLKFYVEIGGSLSDITPIRATTAASDVTFAASAGSDVLTVTEVDHGAVQNDYVTFSGAISLGGTILAAVLNHEYKIASVVDTDNFTVAAVDAAGDQVLAAAGDSGDGLGATVGTYQLNTGTNTYISSTGYGVGPYGGGGWGGGGALLFSGQLRLYSQDSFGDDLIFNPRAGGVYFWDQSSGVGTRAVSLPSMGGSSNAPTAAFQTMVSQVDRHVICFGVNPLGGAAIDPLLIRWSDRENAVDWTPTAINSAGGQVLASGTKIVGAIKTRHEKLIFTDTSIHSMQFSGAPFVYQFSTVAENTTILSPKAATAVGDAVYFMDLEGFYVYKGSVQRVPCTVLEHVFKTEDGGLDRTQAYKVFATTNTSDYEVTWFYPSISDGGSTVGEVDKYVTYNYIENLWTVGTLDRGAWIPAATRSYPIASSNDVSPDAETNYLYNQEFGYNALGVSLDPYVESGSVPIGDGESFVFMDRFISDFRISGEAANANWTVTIKGSDFPMVAPTALATATVMSDTKQSHIRARTREFVLRISASGTDYGWTMGDFRFDLRTDGKR